MSMEHNSMNDPSKTLKSVAARKCSESTETPGYTLVGYIVSWDKESKCVLYHRIRDALKEKDTREACGFIDVKMEKVYRRV